MQNIEQLLNKENWVKYLELATEGGLTDVAIANDIVAHINEALRIHDVVSRRELLLDFAEYSENDKTSTAIDE
jgi:hypothetical protein